MYRHDPLAFSQIDARSHNAVVATLLLGAYVPTVTRTTYSTRNRIVLLGFDSKPMM